MDERCLTPDQPSPPLPDGEHYRNRVQAFLGVETNVRAFAIPANDQPEATDGE